MGCSPRPAAHYTHPTFKSHLKKIPTIPTNITILAMRGFHVDFLSTENVISCGPKLPFYKTKVENRDTLNQ